MSTKKKATPTKFIPKVGQRVRFRSWESMEAQFGLNHNGNIACSFVFSDRMRHLCGTHATVESIDAKQIRLADFSADGDNEWYYSADMLEPVKLTKAAKEAEVKRIAAYKRAEAAKKAAEEKAKAAKKAAEEKAKAAKRATIPTPAQSFLTYLDANRDAFGCQRKHVVATVGAILGVDLTPFI